MNTQMINRKVRFSTLGMKIGNISFLTPGTKNEVRCLFFNLSHDALFNLKNISSAPNLRYYGTTKDINTNPTLAQGTEGTSNLKVDTVPEVSYANAADTLNTFFLKKIVRERNIQMN